MSADRRSHDAAHFQRLYDAAPDPWRFRTSEYEQAKYRRTIAALEGRRFRSGFEVGCSIGVLTRLLAAHCDALFAVDIVEAPLVAARAYCADQPWVRFARMQVPQAWPDARFDLIVLSEVLYFLAPDDIATLAERIRIALTPDGVVLLVNWRGEADDPCTGDEAADLFIALTQPFLAVRTQYRELRFRLDLLGRDMGTLPRTQSIA